MAKPNYGFAKRQRELAKKQKKEEKRLRKAADNLESPEGGMAQAEAEAGVQVVPTAGPQGEVPPQ